MTTILISTHFGRWDEAARALAKEHFILTTENTIEVVHTTVAAIQDALYTLWKLTVDNTIAGFTIDTVSIQGYRAH